MSKVNLMHVRIPRSFLTLTKELPIESLDTCDWVDLTWVFSPRGSPSPPASRQGSRATSRANSRIVAKRMHRTTGSSASSIPYLTNYLLIKSTAHASNALFLQRRHHAAFIQQTPFHVVPVLIRSLNIMTNRAECLLFEQICAGNTAIHRTALITVPASIVILNTYNAQCTQPPQIMTYMIPEFVDLEQDPHIADVRRIKGEEFVGEHLVENSYLANPLYTMLLDMINYNLYYLKRCNALTKVFASRYHVTKEVIETLSPLDTRLVKATRDTYVVETNVLTRQLEEQSYNKFTSTYVEELEANSILPLSFPMTYNRVVPTKRTMRLPATLQSLLTEYQWAYKHGLLTVLHRLCKISKGSVGTVSFAYKETEAEHTILKCRITSPMTLDAHFDSPVFQFYFRSGTKGASFLRYFRGTKAETHGIITYTERYGPRQTVALNQKFYDFNLKRLGFPIMTVAHVCMQLFHRTHFPFICSSTYPSRDEYSRSPRAPASASLMRLIPNTLRYHKDLPDCGVLGTQRPLTRTSEQTAREPEIPGTPILAKLPASPTPPETPLSPSSPRSPVMSGPSAQRDRANTILRRAERPGTGMTDYEAEGVHLDALTDNGPSQRTAVQRLRYRSAFSSQALLSSPRFHVPYVRLQITFLNMICSVIDRVPLSIAAVKNGKESVGTLLHALNGLFSSLHTRYSHVGYSFITIKKKIFYLLKSFSTETFSLIDYFSHYYHIEKGIAEPILAFLMNPATKRELQCDTLPNVHAYIHYYIVKKIHLSKPNAYQKLDTISDDDDNKESVLTQMQIQLNDFSERKGLVNCYLGGAGDIVGADGKIRQAADEEEEETTLKAPAYVCSGYTSSLDRIEVDEATPMLHFAMLYIRLFGIFTRELIPVICTLFAMDSVTKNVLKDNDTLRRNPILCYKLFCRAVISKIQETYIEDLNDWTRYISPRTQISQSDTGSPMATTSASTSAPSVTPQHHRPKISDLSLVLDLDSIVEDSTEVNGTISTTAAVTESIITKRFLSQGFFTTPDGQEINFLHFEFNTQQISRDTQRYVAGEDREGISNLKVIYGNTLEFELSQFRVLIAAIFTSVAELKCNIEQHLEFDLIFLSREIIPEFAIFPSLQVYVQQQTQKELLLIQKELTDYDIINPKNFRDDLKRSEYLSEVASIRCPDFITNYYETRKNMRLEYSRCLADNIERLNHIKEVYGLSLESLNEHIHDSANFDRSIILPGLKTFLAFEKMLSSIGSVSQLCLAFVEQEFCTNTLHISAQDMVFSIRFDPLQDQEQEQRQVQTDEIPGATSWKNVIKLVYPPKFLLNIVASRNVELDFLSLLEVDVPPGDSEYANPSACRRAIKNKAVPQVNTCKTSVGACEAKSLSRVKSVEKLVEMSTALELLENGILVTKDIVVYIKNHLLPLPDVLYSQFASYTIKILKNRAINKLIALIRHIRDHVREAIYLAVQSAYDRILRFKRSLVVDVHTPDDLEMILRSKDAAKYILRVWKPVISIILLILPRLAHLESYRDIDSIHAFASIGNTDPGTGEVKDTCKLMPRITRKTPDIYTLLESDVSFDQKMDHLFDYQFWQRCRRDIEAYEAAKGQEMQKQLENQQAIIWQQEKERQALVTKIATVGSESDDNKDVLHNTYVPEKSLDALRMVSLPMSRKYFSSRLKGAITMQPIQRRQSALVTYRQELLNLDVYEYRYNVLDFFQLLTSITALLKRADKSIQDKIRPFSRCIYLSVEYLMYLRSICTNYAVEVCYMTAADLVLTVQQPSEFRTKYPYITSNLVIEKIDKYFANEDKNRTYMFLNFLQKLTSLAITRYANERSIALSRCYVRPKDENLLGIDSVTTFDDLLAFLIQRISAQGMVRGYAMNKAAENTETYYNIYHMLSDANYIAIESRRIYNALRRWAMLVGIRLSIVGPTFEELATSLKHPINFFSSLINIYATYVQNLKSSISFFNREIFITYSEELFLATREMHLYEKHRIKRAQQKSESRNVKSSSFFTRALQESISTTTQNPSQITVDRDPHESTTKHESRDNDDPINTVTYIDPALVLDGSRATSLPMSSKLESNASDTLLTLLTSQSVSPNRLVASTLLMSASLTVSKLRDQHNLHDDHELPQTNFSPIVRSLRVVDPNNESESDVFSALSRDTSAVTVSTMPATNVAPSKLLMMQLGADLDSDNITSVGNPQQDDKQDETQINEYVADHDGTKQDVDKSKSASTPGDLSRGPDEENTDYTIDSSNDDLPGEELTIGMLRQKMCHPQSSAISQASAYVRLNKAINERVRAGTAQDKPSITRKMLNYIITEESSMSSSTAVVTDLPLTEEGFVLDTSSSGSVLAQQAQQTDQQGVQQGVKKKINRKVNLSIVTNMEEEKADNLLENPQFADPEFLSHNIQQIIEDCCRKNKQPPFTVQYATWIEIADNVVQVHMLAITQRILFVSKVRRLFNSRSFVERLFTMLNKSIGDISTTNARSLLKNTTVQDITSMLTAHNFNVVMEMDKQYEANVAAERKVHRVYEWIISLKLWLIKYTLDLPLHPSLKEFIAEQGRLSQSKSRNRSSKQQPSQISVAKICRPKDSAIESVSPATFQLITRVNQGHRPVTAADLDCSLYCPITLDFSTKYRKKFLNEHRPTRVILFDRLEPLVDLLSTHSMCYDITYQRARDAKSLRAELGVDSLDILSIHSDNDTPFDTPQNTLKQAAKANVEANVDSGASVTQKRAHSAKGQSVQSYDSHELIELDFPIMQPYLAKALREAFFVITVVLGDESIVDAIRVMARRVHILLSAMKRFINSIEKLRLLLPEALALLNAIFDDVIELQFTAIDLAEYRCTVETIIKGLCLLSKICVSIHNPDKKVTYGPFEAPSDESLNRVAVVKNKKLSIPGLEFSFSLTDLFDDTSSLTAQTKHAKLATYLDGDSTCMPLLFLFEHNQCSLVEAFVVAVEQCESMVQRAKQMFRDHNIAYIVSGRLETGLMQLPESFVVFFAKFNGVFNNAQLCNYFFGVQHTGSELSPPLSKNATRTQSRQPWNNDGKTPRNRSAHKNQRHQLPTYAIAEAPTTLSYSYPSGHLITSRLLYSKGGTQISFFGLQNGHEVLFYNKVISLKSRFKLASLLLHPRLVAPAMMAEFRKALILLLNEQYRQLICYCSYQSIMYALSACVLIYTDGRYESFIYCYHNVLGRIKEIIETSHADLIFQMGNKSAELFAESADVDTEVTKLLTVKAIYAQVLGFLSLLDIIALSIISYIFSLNPSYQAQFPKLEPPFCFDNYRPLLRKFAQNTILHEQSSRQGFSLSFMQNKFTSCLYLSLPVLKLFQRGQLTQLAALKDAQRNLTTEAYKKATAIMKRQAPLRSQLDSQNTVSDSQQSALLFGNKLPDPSAAISMSRRVPMPSTTQLAKAIGCGFDQPSRAAEQTLNVSSLSPGPPSVQNRAKPPTPKSPPLPKLEESGAMSREKEESYIDPLPRLIPNDIVTIDADSHIEAVVPLDDPATLTATLLGSCALHEYFPVYAPGCTQYDTIFLDFNHRRLCSLIVTSILQLIPVFIFTDRYFGYRSVEIFYVLNHMMRSFGIRYRFLNIATGNLPALWPLIYSYIVSGITIVLTGTEFLSSEDRMELAILLSQPGTFVTCSSIELHDPVTGEKINQEAAAKMPNMYKTGGMIFWLADAVVIESESSPNYVVSDWIVQFMCTFPQKTQLYLPISYLTNDCHALAMSYNTDIQTYIRTIRCTRDHLSTGIFDLVRRRSTNLGQAPQRSVTSLIGSIVATRCDAKSLFTSGHRDQILAELNLSSEAAVSCVPEALLTIIPQYAEQIALFASFLIRQDQSFPKLILSDVRTIVRTLRSPTTALNLCLSILFYMLTMMEVQEGDQGPVKTRRDYLVTYLESLFSLSGDDQAAFRSLASQPLGKFESALQVYASEAYAVEISSIAQNSGILSVFGAHSLFVLRCILKSNRPCIFFLESMDPSTLMRIKAGIEAVASLVLVFAYNVYELYDLTEAIERSSIEMAVMLICADPEDTYWIGTIFSMCSYRQEIRFPNRYVYTFPRSCKVVVVAHPRCHALRKIMCPNIYFNRSVQLSPLGLLQISFLSVAFLNKNYLHSIKTISSDTVSTYKDVIEHIAMKYDVDYHLYTHAEQTRIKQNVYLNYLNFFYYNITILASRKVFAKYTFSIRDWRVIKALITLLLSYDDIINIKHYMDTAASDDYQLFMSSAKSEKVRSATQIPSTETENKLLDKITKTIDQGLPTRCVSDLNPYAELAYFSYYDQQNIKSGKNEVEYNKECRKNINFTMDRALEPCYSTNTLLYLPSHAGFNQHTQFLCEFTYTFTKLMLVNTNSADVVEQIHSSVFTAIFNALTLFIAVEYENDEETSKVTTNFHNYYVNYLKILPTYMHLVHKFFCPEYKFHGDAIMQKWFQSFYSSVKTGLQSLYAMQLSQCSFINPFHYSRFMCLANPAKLSDETVAEAMKWLQIDRQLTTQLEYYLNQFSAEYDHLCGEFLGGAWSTENRSDNAERQQKLTFQDLAESTPSSTETSVCTIDKNIQNAGRMLEQSGKMSTDDSAIDAATTPYSADLLMRQFRNKNYVNELFDSMTISATLRQLDRSVPRLSAKDSEDGQVEASVVMKRQMLDDAALSNSLHLSSLVNLSPTDSAYYSENTEATENIKAHISGLPESINAVSDTMCNTLRPLDFLRQKYRLLLVPYYIGRDYFTSAALSSFIAQYSDNDTEPPLILTTEAAALTVCMAGFILAGELFMLSGPRFTGKTTLLKLAYTIIPEGLVSLSSFKLAYNEKLDIHKLLQNILQRQMVLKPETALQGEYYTLSPLEHKLLIVHIEGIDEESLKALLQLNLQDGLLHLTPSIAKLLEPGLNSTGMLFLPCVLFVYEVSIDSTALTRNRKEFYTVEYVSTSTAAFLRRFFLCSMVWRKFALQYYKSTGTDAVDLGLQENKMEQYLADALFDAFQHKVYMGPVRELQSSYSRVSYLQQVHYTYKDVLAKLPIAEDEVQKAVDTMVWCLKRLQPILPISLLELAYSILQNSACDDQFCPDYRSHIPTIATVTNSCFQFPSTNLLLSTLVRHPRIAFGTVVQLVNCLLEPDSTDPLCITHMPAPTTHDLKLSVYRSSCITNLSLFHENWLQGLSLFLKYPDQPVEDFVMDSASDSYYAKHKRALYSAMDDTRDKVFCAPHTRSFMPYYSKLGHLVYFKLDLGEHPKEASPRQTPLANSTMDMYLIGRTMMGFSATMDRLHMQSAFESEKLRSLIPKRMLEKSNMMSRRAMSSSAINLTAFKDYDSFCAESKGVARPASNVLATRPPTTDSRVSYATNLDSSDENTDDEKSHVLKKKSMYGDNESSVIALLISRCRGVSQVDTYAVAALIHLCMAINRAFQANIIKVAEYILYMRKGPTHTCSRFVQFNPLINPPRIPILSLLVPSSATSSDSYAHYIAVLKLLGQYAPFDSVEFFEFACGHVYSPNDGIIKISVEKRAEAFKIYESSVIEESVDVSICPVGAAAKKAKKAKKEVSLKHLFQGRVPFANYRLHFIRFHRFLVDFNILLRYVQSALDYTSAGKVKESVYDGKSKTGAELLEVSDEEQFVSRVDPRILRKMPKKVVLTPEGLEFKRDKEIVKTYSGKLSKADPFFWIFKEKAEQLSGSFAPMYDYRHHRHVYFNRMVSLLAEHGSIHSLARYFVRSMLLMALGFSPLLGLTNLSYFTRDIYNFRACYTCELWPFINMAKIHKDLGIEDLMELVLPEPCDIVAVVPLIYLNPTDISLLPQTCPFFDHLEIKFISYLISFTYGLQILFSEAEVLWLFSRNFALLVLEAGETIARHTPVKYTAFTPRISTILLEEQLYNLSPHVSTCYKQVSNPSIRPLYISDDMRQLLNMFTISPMLGSACLQFRAIMPHKQQPVPPLRTSEVSIAFQFLKVITEKYVRIASKPRRTPMPSLFLMIELGWLFLESRLSVLNSYMTACNVIIRELSSLHPGSFVAEDNSFDDADNIGVTMNTSGIITSLRESSVASYATTHSHQKTTSARNCTARAQTRGRSGYGGRRSAYSLFFGLDPKQAEVYAGATQLLEALQNVDDQCQYGDLIETYVGYIEGIKHELENATTAQLELSVELVLLLLSLDDDDFAFPVLSNQSRTLVCSQVITSGQRAISASATYSSRPKDARSASLSEPGSACFASRMLCLDDADMPRTLLAMPENSLTPLILTVFLSTLQINLKEALAVTEILLDSGAACLPEELRAGERSRSAKYALVESSTLVVVASYMLCAQTNKVIPLIPASHAFIAVLLLEACYKPTLVTELRTRLKEVDLDIEFRINYIDCCTTEHAFLAQLVDILQEDTNRYGAILFYNCFERKSQTSRLVLKLVRLLTGTNLSTNAVIMFDNDRKIRLKYGLSNMRIYFALAHNIDRSNPSFIEAQAYVHRICLPLFPHEAFLSYVESCNSSSDVASTCSSTTSALNQASMVFSQTLQYAINYATMFETHPLLSTMTIFEQQRDILKNIAITSAAIGVTIKNRKDKVSTAKQVQTIVGWHIRKLLMQASALSETHAKCAQSAQTIGKSLTKVIRAQTALFAYLHSLTGEYQQLSSLFAEEFFVNWSWHMVDALCGLSTKNEDMLQTHLTWVLQEAVSYPLQHIVRLLPLTKVEPTLFVSLCIYYTALSIIHTEELVVAKLVISLSSNQFEMLAATILEGNCTWPVSYTSAQTRLLDSLSLSKTSCAEAAVAAKFAETLPPKPAAAWRRLAVLQAFLPKLVAPWLDYFQRDKKTFVLLSSSRSFFRMFLGYYLSLENERVNESKITNIATLIAAGTPRTETEETLFSDFLMDQQRLLRPQQKRATTAPANKYLKASYQSKMHINQVLPKITKQEASEHSLPEDGQKGALLEHNSDIAAAATILEETATALGKSASNEAALEPDSSIMQLFKMQYMSSNGPFCPARQTLLYSNTECDTQATTGTKGGSNPNSETEPAHEHSHNYSHSARQKAAAKKGDASVDSLLKRIKNELEGYIRYLELPLDMSSLSARNVWKAFLMSLLCDYHSLSDICILFLRVSPFSHILEYMKEYYKDLADDSASLATFMGESRWTPSFNLTTIVRGYLSSLISSTAPAEGSRDSAKDTKTIPLSNLLAAAQTAALTPAERCPWLLLWYDDSVDLRLLLKYAHAAVWQKVVPQMTLTFSPYPGESLLATEHAIVVILLRELSPQIDYLLEIRHRLRGKIRAHVIVCLQTRFRNRTSLADTVRLITVCSARAEHVYMPESVFRRYKEYFTMIMALTTVNVIIRKQLAMPTDTQSQMLVLALLLFSNLDRTTYWGDMISDQLYAQDTTCLSIYCPALLSTKYAHFAWIVKAIATVHRSWNALLEFRSYLSVYIAPEERALIENTHDDDLEYQRTHRYSLESLVSTAINILSTSTAAMLKETKNGACLAGLAERFSINFLDLPLVCRMARDFSDKAPTPLFSMLPSNYLLDSIVSPQLIKAFEKGLTDGEYPLLHPRIYNPSDLNEEAAQQLSYKSKTALSNSQTSSSDDDHDNGRGIPNRGSGTGTGTPASEIGEVTEKHQSSASSTGMEAMVCSFIIDHAQDRENSATEQQGGHNENNVEANIFSSELLNIINRSPQHRISRRHGNSSNAFTTDTWRQASICIPDTNVVGPIFFNTRTQFMNSLDAVGTVFGKISHAARYYNTNKRTRIILSQTGCLVDNATPQSYGRHMQLMIGRLITFICGSQQTQFYDNRLVIRDCDPGVSDASSRLFMRFSTLVSRLHTQKPVLYAHTLIKDASLLFRSVGHTAGCVSMHARVYGSAVLEVLTFRRVTFADAHSIPLENTRTVLMTALPNTARYYYELEGANLAISKWKEGAPRYNYAGFAVRMIGMKLYGMTYDTRIESLVDTILAGYGGPATLDMYAFPVCYLPQGHQTAPQDTGPRTTSQLHSRQSSSRFVPVPCPAMPSLQGFLWNGTELTTEEVVQRGAHLDVN